MNAKKLHAAVKCCTRGGDWASTCGKCPFCNPRENGGTSCCIDKLILALAEYLPKEDED